MLGGSALYQRLQPSQRWTYYDHRSRADSHQSSNAQHEGNLLRHHDVADGNHERGHQNQRRLHYTVNYEVIGFRGESAYSREVERHVGRKADRSTGDSAQGDADRADP